MVGILVNASNLFTPSSCVVSNRQGVKAKHLCSWHIRGVKFDTSDAVQQMKLFLFCYFRAKQAGWPRSPRPHVYVLPARQPPLAGTQGGKTVNQLFFFPCLLLIPVFIITFHPVCRLLWIYLSLSPFLLGWHSERTLSEDRRHKERHTNRGPLWELPRFVYMHTFSYIRA